MEEYDLIVLGSGSGLDVASAMANRGKKVAIVEPGRVGGTCLNRGCIPSKMLIHRADILKEIQNSEEFGIKAQVNQIKFQQIIEEVNEEVHGDSENIKQGIKDAENQTLYEELGEFKDNNTIKLKESGEEITADKILVAAGSRPFVPPIEGTEDVEYWVSTDALNPDHQPESIIMIGGGYITMELAHFYEALGTEVTILERGQKVLKREDEEVSAKITEIAKKRYDLQLEVSANQIKAEDGKKKVKAENKEGETVEFEAEEIMFATGRVPNTDSIKTENTDIETTERGFIQTNQKMETDVENVYALGDIADNWMFKHSANYESEIVFKNMLTNNKFDLDNPVMPHAVFTSPQIAGAGKTEQQLKEEGTEYVKAKQKYSQTGMGQALKEKDGFVKVLASEDGEILGCHIIGPHASQQIHEVLIAMEKANNNVKDIKDTIHIHPALNEVVQRAFKQL